LKENNHPQQVKENRATPDFYLAFQGRCEMYKFKVINKSQKTIFINKKDGFNNNHDPIIDEHFSL
jgi:hypothetical protein